MPKYTGPQPPWEYLQGLDKYTWMKAPRYDGRPMQVGPLARIAGGLRAGAPGHAGARQARRWTRLKVGPAALFSTAGRTLARGMETVLIARQMDKWIDQLVAADQERRRRDVHDGTSGSRRRGRPRPQGFGRADVPRGALGHWVQIENGKFTRYQCVVPSTWNCSRGTTRGRRARTRRR